MSVLNQIVSDKHQELVKQKAQNPLAALLDQIPNAPPLRNFKRAIENPVVGDQPALIAEIKKASPSKGLIRPSFQPANHAKAYQSGGASCLSVLTNHHFLGSDADFIEVRAATDLPMLRKDFMIDPWQIVQSRLLGADCILLILALLSDDEAVTLYQIASKLQMDVLVEVHNADELLRALPLPDNCLIGINNRNLHNFETRLETTAELANQIAQNRIVISESGIKNTDDVEQVANAGVSGILVGESLMRQPDIALATMQLLSNNGES